MTDISAANATPGDLTRAGVLLVGRPGSTAVVRTGDAFPADTVVGLARRLNVPVAAGDPGWHRPAIRGGLVVGVGPLRAAAVGYADALDRPVQLVPDLTGLEAILGAAQVHGSAFLIVPERWLTVELTNRITALAAGLPVGLLPVPAGDAGATTVLRMLLLHAAPPDYSTHSALYCDFVDRVPGTAAADLVFGAHESAEFLATLRRGVAAAVVHSHGNGADFRVGDDVLCVQVGRPRPDPGRPGESFLPCQSGGPCRLDHKTSFTAFHGADAIRARVLVLISCAAFHPAGGLLDLRFQLISALLTGQHVTAVITSTRINFSTPELGAAVLHSLRAGTSVGEVTSRMNQIAWYGPPSFLCIGDPETRLPKTVGPPPARAASRVDAAAGHLTPTAVRPDTAATNRVTQEMLVRRAVAVGDYEQEEGIRLAESLAASARAAERADDRLDHDLCLFLERILQRRGPDVHDYLSGVTSYGPQRFTGDNHVCGERLLRLTLNVRPVSGHRHLHICERCGIVGNVPHGSRVPSLRMDAEGRLTADIGSEPVRGWYAVGRQPVGGHGSLSLGVRRLSTGQFTVTVPIRPTDGLRRWAVAVVLAGDYSVIQVPVGADDPRGGAQ
jgi:hypothetical protein